MKKKSSPGPVLLRCFTGILAAFIALIALANFISGGGLFATVLFIFAALFIAPIKSIAEIKKKYRVKPSLTVVLMLLLFFSGILFSNVPSADKPAAAATPAATVEATQEPDALAVNDFNESQKEKKTFQTEQKRSRNRKLERVLQLHPLRPLQVRSLRQRLHRQSSLPRFQLPRLRRNRHSLLKPSYYTQILLIIATPGKSKSEILSAPMFSMVQAAGIHLLI